MQTPRKPGDPICASHLIQYYDLTLSATADWVVSWLWAWYWLADNYWPEHAFTATLGHGNSDCDEDRWRRAGNDGDFPDPVQHTVQNAGQDSLPLTELDWPAALTSSRVPMATRK